MRAMIKLLAAIIFMMAILCLITICGLNTKYVSQNAILNMATTSYMLGCVSGSDDTSYGSKLRSCLKGGMTHRKDVGRITGWSK